MTPTRRAGAWGAAALGAYLMAAWLSNATGFLPGRPLFDGLAPPPPYRYVKPPPDLAGANEKPESGSGTVVLSDAGSQAASLSTDDGQADVVFPQDSVLPKHGETEVKVTLTPLDPSKLPGLPKGLTVDGNGYRVTAVYGSSGAPVALAKAAQIVLRFPTVANDILLRSGSRWKRLAATPAGGQQIFADTKTFGTFVAAGAGPAQPKGVAWWAYAAGGLGLVLVAGGYLFTRRRAVSRSSKRRRR